MKKSLLVPLLALVASQVFAQKVISAHASLPLLGKFGFYLERPLNKKFSLLAHYERWQAETNQSDASIFFPISWVTSSSAEINIKGSRWGLQGRVYAGKMQNSIFLEAGVNSGRHEITVKERSTDWIWVYLLPLPSHTTKEKVYKNVRASSFQVGIGIKKRVIGPFTAELSLGLSGNSNNKNIREIRGIEGLSGYFRLSGGVTF